MIGERSRSGFGVCRSPIGRLDEEIVERARHVRAGEWLRDEQHATRLSHAEAGVGFLRRVADDHDRQVGVIRMTLSPESPAVMASCARAHDE